MVEALTKVEEYQRATFDIIPWTLDRQESNACSAVRAIYSNFQGAFLTNHLSMIVIINHLTFSSLLLLLKWSFEKFKFV